MMRKSLAPSAFDAIMNSRVRRDRVSLLTSRAVPVQPVRPIASIISVRLEPKRYTIRMSKSTVSAGEQYTVTLTGFPASTEMIGWTAN